MLPEQVDGGCRTHLLLSAPTGVFKRSDLSQEPEQHLQVLQRSESLGGRDLKPSKKELVNGFRDQERPGEAIDARLLRSVEVERRYR